MSGSGAITVAAKYEYDPYGNTLSALGDYAAVNPFRFSTKWLDSELASWTINGAVGSTGMYYYGYRYYSPRLGRWISRDPIGERGGSNLIAFVGNNSVGRIDFLGKWGEDVHRDLTWELAKMAGISCWYQVGVGANQPDVDPWRRPGTRGVLDYLAMQARLDVLSAEAKLNGMAQWHFPADLDGIVRPYSVAAKAAVKYGISTCNFTAFAEGLHVLQDSWSHQGKAYVEGVGHYRGVSWVPDTMGTMMGGVSIGLPTGHWKNVSGTALAATGETTDNAKLFPRDVRNAGRATYVALLKFKKACPSHCPNLPPRLPDGTHCTSSGPFASFDKVDNFLSQRYRGENVIETPYGMKGDVDMNGTGW